MSDRPKDIERIFLAALEKPTPGERAAYLDQACGEDADLRRQVDALLQAHENAGSFLGKPPAGLAATAVTGDANPSSGGSPEGEEFSLDFLETCENPDRLGRLGTYEITEVIGHGGMGIVLKAHDPKLNRIVALKALAPQLASNAAARRRFMREARAAAAVSHDHVVTIHGVDEGNRIPFLVMEYIDGISLDHRIKRDGPLRLREILRIGMQAASGLAAAHAQGLVHRDVKPSNILLENGVERVKITDFGLARAAQDAQITQTGVVAGTPEFMSPEQARGETVDHRSDLFSLGCVLYAMCTGRSPFRATTAVDAIRRVCDDTPRPIPEVNPEIPDWLVAIIDRLLAKDREGRFQSASDVSELLGDSLAHLQRPDDVPKPRLRRDTVRDAHRRRGRRRLIGFVAATVVVLLIAFFLRGFIGLTPRKGERLPAGEHATASNTAQDVPTNTAGRGINERGSADPKGPLAQSGMGWLALTPDQIGPRFPEMRVSVTGGDENLSWNAAFSKTLTLPARQYRVEVRDTERKDELIRSGPLTIVAGGKRRLRVAAGTLLPMPPQPTALTELPVKAGAHGHRFSSDGKMVAVPCFGDTVEVWSFSGQNWRLKEHKKASARVLSASFSPNGNLLAAACENGTVDMWDLRTSERLGPFNVFYREPARWVEFSSDGRTVASASPTRVRVWQWDAGGNMPTFNGNAADGEGCDLSPDGTMLATKEGAAIALWDLAGPERLSTLRGHTNDVQSLAFSPDGRMLASSSLDCTIKLWDLESGTPVRTLTGHRGPVSIVNSVAFSPDGATLASGDWGQIVCLWDVDSGRLRSEFHAHWDRIRRVSFLPDGNTLATSSWDYAVRLWSIPELPHVQAVQRPDPALLASFGPVTVGSDFSPSPGVLATLDGLGCVELWRMMDDTWTKLGQVEAHSPAFSDAERAESWSVVMSQDATRLATATNADGIKLWQWDGDTGELTLLETVPSDRQESRLAMSPNSQTLAVTQNEATVKLLDATTGEIVDVLKSAYGQPEGMAFSPDGSLLAAGTHAGNVLLWQLGADGDNPVSMPHGESRIFSLSFSPDSSLIASASEDGTVKLWDVAGPELLHTLDAHPEMALCAAFSPDGQILATGGGHVDFGDDDWFLKNFGGGKIKLWDVASGRLLAEFEGHNRPVLQVVFLEDRTRLLTRGLDFRARVWDVSELLEQGTEKPNE